MTTWQLLTTVWDFHPSVVLGCLALWLAYVIPAKFRFDAKTIWYSLGVLIIFLALTSPVDDLGDDYLFSAHMLQHMMLGSFAPPLMVAGLRESFVRAWLKFRPIAWAENFLGYPPIAVAANVLTFWIWHYPKLYNLTLENETVHIFEHLTFIATGCMLWWPIFKPIPERRLKPLPSIVYLMCSALPNSVLGMIFTVSETPFYSDYANPEDELGVLKLIREGWGLTQIDDQKLGGAFMWAGGDSIILWAVMVIMAKWLKEDTGAGGIQESEPPKEPRS